MKKQAIISIGDRIKLSIPFLLSKVKAGFPSPADEYLEKTIDFNQFLVQHPAATFCMRVSGSSMTGASINDGDILVIDRSLEPTNNRIVVAAVDGDLTVKRLNKSGNKILLMPENPEYQPLEIKDSSFEIWGVVTFVIHYAE
jgi:DNA polymerase V